MDSSPDITTTSGPAKGWPIHKERGADMIGELIDGHFKIIRRIAKGGMADVFFAKDVTRKCHVAIKILRSRSPESVRRFVVEGEVLSNIKHPNIVRATAVGRTQDGHPYIALEHLAGEPLSRSIEQGPVPWRDAAAIMIQVAGAVHALHVAGIVHRDVKPANIMLTLGADRSFAHVIDLGLASVGAPYQDVQDAHFTPDPPSRHQTQLGHPIGTPPFLPPEAGHCPAEPRLDVYSLGATLYQLCTRLLPYTTGGRPIREVCPGSDAPDDLWRLVQAALAPDPAERLPSADHLRRGLEAIVAAHPRNARPMFGGSYDRLEVLGVGASAVVFRASDRWLSREVAVKVLRDAEPSEDDAIRFRRAAKVLSALRHPNIPRILHFGIHRSSSGDEQTFAVTELCPGSPATHVVRPDNHLRPDEVLAVGLQLAGALAAVHAAGIVYRDLHPGNVLIARGERPSAWLFDFDQAQVSPEFYANLTERWATPPEERVEPKQGKPLQAMDYAAPEVRAGAAFSAASDVYALGLLLYRLLTGKRPFPVAGGEPTPARKLCTACPHELEGLLLGMLNSAPNARPSLHLVQTTVQMIREDEGTEFDELDDSSGAPDVAEPPTVGVPPTDTTATMVPATVAIGTGPTPHQPRRIFGLLALTLTVAVGVAIGRATVTHDGAVSVAMMTLRANEVASDPVVSASPTLERRPSPVIGKGTLEIAEDTAKHTRVIKESTPVPMEKKRSAASRASQPEAVTIAEAKEAAQRALPALRACDDVPSPLTVDLDIVDGRGIVTALNIHAPAPEDPNYRWHGCARRSLESVPFPKREAAGQVRVRLILR